MMQRALLGSCTGSLQAYLISTMTTLARQVTVRVGHHLMRTTENVYISLHLLAQRVLALAHRFSTPT